jgi:hypothetical protein
MKPPLGCVVGHVEAKKNEKVRQSALEEFSIYYNEIASITRSVVALQENVLASHARLLVSNRSRKIDTRATFLSSMATEARGE